MTQQQLDELDRQILAAWERGAAREVVLLLARKYRSEELITEVDIVESVKHIEEHFRLKQPISTIVHPGDTNGH